MRRLRTLLLVVAFFSLGAAATAGAKRVLSGKSFRKASISTSRFTAKARSALRAQSGPAGVAGAAGPQGAPGGPGGPGAAAANGPPGAAGVTGGSLLAGFSAATDPTDYVSVQGALIAPGTNEGAVQSPAGPYASSANGLTVSLAGPSLSAVTVTLRVNGTDSPVTCMIALAATKCKDTADSAPVAPGSLLDFKVSGGIPLNPHIAIAARLGVSP